MDSHQRRMLHREMQRLGLAPPNTTPKPQPDPAQAIMPIDHNRVARFVRFLEHPWMLWVFGVIGGIVGLIYTPALFVVAAAMVGAFHRERVVEGMSWKIQVPAYLVIFGFSIGLAYGTATLIKRNTHIPAAQEIAYAITERMNPKAKPAPPDPEYPPPNGNLVRMEGTIEPPSNQMCQGMPDEAGIRCLCPSPLDYTLRAMEPPTDNNYATEINIKQVGRSIYRARVFARTMVDPRHGFVPDPPNDSHSASFLGTLANDPYSFVVSATAPKKGFKVIVHTSEGLRLKCINQEN